MKTEAEYKKLEKQLAKAIQTKGRLQDRIRELEKVKDHCTKCNTTEFLCGHNAR